MNGEGGGIVRSCLCLDSEKGMECGCEVCVPGRREKGKDEMVEIQGKIVADEW